MPCSLPPVGALLTTLQLNSPLIIILHVTVKIKNGNPQETIKQEECLRSSLQLFCGGPPASSWFRLASDFFASCMRLSLILDCGIQLVRPPLGCRHHPHQGRLHPSPECLAIRSYMTDTPQTLRNARGQRCTKIRLLPFCLRTGVNIKTTRPGCCSLHLVPCSCD